MGKVLVIVDIQKEFDEFIQHDMVDSLSKYAENFDKVYQIWDTHNDSVAPTHSFPNQVDSIPKKYGKKHFSDEVKQYIKEIEDSSEDGRTFKLSDGAYIVRVTNNHGWFYVNKEIIDLIFELKNKKIILVGGATDECLEDIYQTFKAFGLNVHINKKYTYDAKTTKKDSVQQEKILIPNIEVLIEKNNDLKNAKEIAVLLNNIEERNKLNEMAVNINSSFSIRFAHEFPCVVYFSIGNYKNSCWSQPGSPETRGALSGNFKNNDILDGVYNHLFTIKDFNLIKRMLKENRILPPYPTYNKREFVYERFNHEKNGTLVFEPNNEKESEEAQKIAFDLDYSWAGVYEKEIQYTDVLEGKFLTFQIDSDDKLTILRIPVTEQFNMVLDSFNRDEKIKNLIDYINDNIIYTNNINEFKKLIGYVPEYKPKKFIY